MSKWWTVAGVFSALLTSSACTLDNPGIAPVEGELYFPSELALSPSIEGAPPKFLFIGNSNFDLRYTSGTVLSLDAEQLASVARSCTAAQNGYPCVYEPSRFRLGEVQSGSFPGGMAVSHDGNRLYIPFRSNGEDGLTHIEIAADGSLSCSDETGSFTKCDDEHSSVDLSLADLRDVDPPSDPVRVIARPLSAFDDRVADDAGEAILVADRTGAVTLYVDTSTTTDRKQPKFVDFVAGLPAGVAGFDLNPRRAEVWTTSARTSGLGRVGVTINAMDPTFETSFVFVAGILSVRGLSLGSDMRDVAFLPSSSRVVLASRSPESVLIADVSSSTDTLMYDRVIDVDSGPSRITAMHFGDRDYALVSCYDAQVLWLIDLTLNRDVGVIRGFSGPFSLAVDEQRALMHVVDFRSSTLRVVDLAPLMDDDTSTVPFVAAQIGTPYFAGQPR